MYYNLDYVFKWHNYTSMYLVTSSSFDMSLIFTGEKGIQNRRGATVATWRGTAQIPQQSEVESAVPCVA